MPSPQPRADGSPFSATPVNLIVLLFLAVFLGYLLGAGAAYGLCALAGKDLFALIEGFSTESSAADRQWIRLINGVNHGFTFLIPALIVSWLAYGKSWPASLRLQTRPSFIALLLGVAFILAAFPFAQWLYRINQNLPLPSSLVQMEESANDMILALLRMESPAELLLNLLVIAVLPALGEEMIFRGLLQQQLQRLSANPHLAIWVAAVVFSIFHLQFQGFLPRLALGALLGYLFWWSGSLWVPILAHGANNALQVLAQFWSEGDLMAPEQTETMHWGWGLLSLLLILAIGFIFQTRYSGLSNP